MGKPQVRPSKAGKANKTKEIDQEEEEEDDVMVEPTSRIPPWIKEAFPDPTSLAAGLSLVVMIFVLGLLIWVNSTGGIEPYMKGGPLEVVILDTEFDKPAEATKKDKDDLLETYAAVDNIERLVQHGNIAAARSVLQQLTASKPLSEEDKAALASLIDDAEAKTPIADLAQCRANEAMDYVIEKGGKFMQADGEAGIMMADFDADQEEPDGRGRGIAALAEAKEGDMLMEVPIASGLSIWSAQSSSIAHVIKNEKFIHSFNGLCLFLLHEAHKADSVHRKHLCSLPLHIPLPFLWLDADLPPEFLADPQVTLERTQVTQLVDVSYNITVPPLLEKYPDLFTEDRFSRAKWAWAAAIVLSRSLAVTKSFMGGYALDNTTKLDPVPQLDIMQGKAKDVATHVIVPGVDMLNHEGSTELACTLALKSDGTVRVAASPGGLKRGYEMAFPYGDHLCGTKPLNRWGFVLPACPGDEAAEGSKEGGEGAQEGAPATEEGAASSEEEKS